MSEKEIELIKNEEPKTKLKFGDWVEVHGRKVRFLDVEGFGGDQWAKYYDPETKCVVEVTINYQPEKI